MVIMRQKSSLAEDYNLNFINVYRQEPLISMIIVLCVKTTLTSEHQIEHYIGILPKSETVVQYSSKQLSQGAEQCDTSI